MTNWYVPLVTPDVTTVMSGVIIGAVQQTGTINDSDLDQANKIQFIINMVVAKVRGAIGKGNRTPLSATASSVPPEGQQHTLNLIVEALVNTTPNMGWSLKEDFLEMLKEAKQWLKELGDGQPTDYPTDPITVDAGGYPAATGGFGGNIHGEVYLGTDELPNAPYIPPIPVGNTQYTGTTNPNGVITANIGDQFLLYDSTGQLQSVWTKGGQSGTNTNWSVMLI